MDHIKLYSPTCCLCSGWGKPHPPLMGTGTGTGASVWFPETGSSSCLSDLCTSDWESEREGDSPESGWALPLRSAGKLIAGIPRSWEKVHTSQYNSRSLSMMGVQDSIQWRHSWKHLAALNWNKLFFFCNIIYKTHNTYFNVMYKVIYCKYNFSYHNITAFEDWWMWSERVGVIHAWSSPAAVIQNTLVQLSCKSHWLSESS